MSNQNFSLTWSVSEEDSGSLLREFLSKCDISKRALTDIKFKGGLYQGERLRSDSKGAD